MTAIASTDASGGVIANATVTATSVDTGQTAHSIFPGARIALLCCSLPPGIRCAVWRLSTRVHCGLVHTRHCAPPVSRIYPGHLVWTRSAIRLALAAFLYLLRPRETHWKPAGTFWRIT